MSGCVVAVLRRRLTYRTIHRVHWRRAAAQRLVRWAVLLGWLAGVMAPIWQPRPVQAQSQNRFVFIVPSGFETDFIAFWERYSEDLQATYDFFSLLYGVEPPLPVYIQVYASRDELYKLNLLVPPLPDDATHTHLGAREISLIAPFPAGFMRSRLALDAVRFELNNVFLSALSGGNLPPALKLGLSQYIVLDEAGRREAVERLEAAQQQEALYTWRGLMDNPIVHRDVEVAHPQAFAVVAYLADRFGFPSLVGLMTSLRTQTVDDALATVYGEPMDRLELDWQAYLPGFLAERWQYNALYDFDLKPFEAALEAGAYSQVAQGLAAVQPFLEATGQTEALAQAAALAQRAEQGLAAGELVVQARYALEAGLYERTLELVARARDAYAELGQQPREAELAAYAERAQRVLDLRTQLAEAVRLFEAGRVQAAEARLLRLVPELQAAGDSTNAAVAESLVQVIYEQRLAAAAERAALARRAVYVFLGALAVVVLHQGTRAIYRHWRKPEPSVL